MHHKHNERPRCPETPQSRETNHMYSLYSALDWLIAPYNRFHQNQTQFQHQAAKLACRKNTQTVRKYKYGTDDNNTTQAGLHKLMLCYGFLEGFGLQLHYYTI